LLELAARAAGLSSRVAAALLEQVTLGLAEPGNTSVRVLVPVSSGAAPSAELVSHAAEGGLGPPGRRVTEALTLLVARAQRAAQAAVTAKTLDPFVAEDVSAASCHALAAIGVPLALELGWALTLPRKAVPTVHFSPEQLAVLAAAAERLSPPRA
jgi:hypothetical protein